MLVVQVLGHAAAVLTFTAVAMYGYLYRNNLRRNVTQSRYLYRLILATGIVFAGVHLFRLYTLAAPDAPPGFFSWIDVIAEYPSVIAQSVIIFYLLANKIIIERAGRPHKVLVIAAHPLELELAAGASLAKMNDAGFFLAGLVLSGGAAAEEEDRPGRSAKILGMDRMAYKRFPENAFQNHLDELSRVIRAEIEQVAPEIILTASCHDPNTDRQAVYAATLQAAAEHNAILSYESRSGGMDFCPTLFIDVAGYVAIKQSALQVPMDERFRPAAHPEQVQARLAFRGLQAKVPYAEGFEVVRLLSSSLADL